MKRMAFVCAALMVLACISCAAAASFVLPVRGASVEVLPSEMDGESWLFLPSFADPDSLGLSWTGDEEDGVRTAEKDGESWNVMRSAHVRTLFLFSDDPENEGREYIDNCKKHANRTTGSMALVSADGTVDYAGRLRQLRGRGNGSWENEKKPYQIKLEERADLLNTGEAARTWVLLAEYTDATMLRNRIALDLALEMGLEETSHSEYVDLYYDGEYRGLYLLCEKVEIDEARVDEMDYDDLIETWNKNAGVNDLEKLAAAQGENALGNEIHFIEGLYDNGVTDAGAYLLEMEDEAATLSDRCWFRMDDESVIALKNPENASEPMVRFISEKLTEARRALADGTDEEIEALFDVDAFARTALLYELSYSDSGFHYSSTYFVLPAGEERFRPGPVWDFDLTWGYYRKGVNAGGAGVKDAEGWLTEFYEAPVFARSLRKNYLEQMYPLVQNILLGESEGRWLKPLSKYDDMIAQARRMNSRLWPHVPFWRFEPDADCESAVEQLRSFIQERSAWLHRAFSNAGDTADGMTLWAWSPYTYVEDDLQLYICPWDHARIRSYELEQLSEATEEDYALWRLEAVLEPEEGYAFENPRILLCGTEMTCEWLEDGAVRIAAEFEDPSYRPVDYYGEDIGLVYNPDVYAANYPEIAAEYEDDPEGLMDYFCDDGMYEDHMGNAFFRPSELLEFRPDMMDLFGEDWQLYYWDFLYYGYEDGWLSKPGRGFIPEMKDAL